MTRQEAVWHANHVFNIVIERCINAQNLKDAREFDEAKQIVIEALQQEPKRGEWLDAREEDPCWFICSECKTMVDADYNYCPHCGAKMESDGE